MSVIDDLKGLPERVDALERKGELALAPYTVVASDGTFVRMNIYTGQTWKLDKTLGRWLRLDEEDEDHTGVAFRGL